MSYQQESQLAAFSFSTKSEAAQIKATILAQVKARVLNTVKSIPQYHAKFAANTKIINYPDASQGQQLALTNQDTVYEIDGQSGNYVRLGGKKWKNGIEQGQTPAYVAVDRERYRLAPNQTFQYSQNGKWTNYTVALYRVGVDDRRLTPQPATIANLYDVLLYGGTFQASGTGPSGKEGVNGTVNDWLGLKWSAGRQLVATNSTNTGGIERWGGKSSLLEWRDKEGEAADLIIKATNNKINTDTGGPFAYIKNMGITVS